MMQRMPNHQVDTPCCRNTFPLTNKHHCLTIPDWSCTLPDHPLSIQVVYAASSQIDKPLIA